MTSETSGACFQSFGQNAMNFFDFTQTALFEQIDFLSFIVMALHCITQGIQLVLTRFPLLLHCVVREFQHLPRMFIVRRFGAFIANGLTAVFAEHRHASVTITGALVRCGLGQFLSQAFQPWKFDERGFLSTMWATIRSR